MLYSTKQCEHMLDKLEERSHALSDWECNFVDSVQKQISDGAKLSNKQKECIGKIWEKNG